VYRTTGFSKDEIAELCTLVHATGMSSGGDDGYPPVLGLFTSVVVALTYLRRHHVQQELAEYYEVSQSTTSRAITAITPELARVMRPFTPTAEELPRDEQLIVDGTLVSCWSWDNHPELHSGTHHTTGLNIHVVCDLVGRLRWISDPVEGCRHDSAALRLSGVLDEVETQNWIARHRLHRPRHDHTHQKTTTPRTPRLGEKVQHCHQQNPLENRTGDRQPEDLENPPHRLPPTTRNPRGHHQCRHRTTILPDRVNKPRCRRTTW
jgi:hypothetical protein